MRQSRGAKGRENKRSDFEKRINREQVVCQSWATVKERRHPARGRISLGIPGPLTERRGFIYFGAELGWHNGSLVHTVQPRDEFSPSALSL